MHIKYIQVFIHFTVDIFDILFRLAGWLDWLVSLHQAIFQFDESTHKKLRRLIKLRFVYKHIHFNKLQLLNCERMKHKKGLRCHRRTVRVHVHTFILPVGFMVSWSYDCLTIYIFLDWEKLSSIRFCQFFVHIFLFFPFFVVVDKRDGLYFLCCDIPRKWCRGEQVCVLEWLFVW